MEKVTLERFNSIKSYLAKKNKDYTLLLNTNSRIIDSGGYKYIYSDKPLSFKDLGFIRRVRKEVMSNVKGSVSRPDSNKYFHLFGKPGIHKDFVEFDINKAYWYIAYNNGLISESLFNDGLNEDKIDKRLRLISLGSLATKYYMYQMKGKELKGRSVKLFDKNGRNVFLSICNQLDSVMFKVMQSVGFDNFLGYWVDALFVRRDKVKNVIDIIDKEFDLSGKIVECSSILIKDIEEKRMMYVFSIGESFSNKSNIDIKPFFVRWLINEEERMKRMMLSIIGNM